ncbi:MAG: hypothetical protein ACE5J9_00825 [Methanosarcinales archaeon]
MKAKTFEKKLIRYLRQNNIPKWMGRSSDLLDIMKDGRNRGCPNTKSIGLILSMLSKKTYFNEIEIRKIGPSATRAGGRIWAISFIREGSN